MNKIISSFTIATLLLSSFGGFPLSAVAQEVPQAPNCSVQTVDIFSDTTNTVNDTDTPAVATYTGNPLWTANIPGATWIWDSADVADSAVDHTAVFSKTFTLTDGTISSVVFDIAADNGYTLVINDQVIEDKITVENNFEAAHQTHYNIAALFPALLHTGENTIKVTVKNFALVDSNPHGNPAGLLYKMSVGIIPHVIETKTLVSDTQTQVGGHGAALVSPTHPAWTTIDGASWIWSENPIADAINETTQTFTRTFTIGGTPTDASLDSATDNDYSIEVNGHSLGSGTSTFNSAQHITIPAADLVTGLNTVTFTVKNEAAAEGTPATNPAGLLYKVSYQTDACANSIVPENHSTEKGTIQLKNVVTPHDDSSWNAGIDASYTFWATWIHDGYDSGPIEVTPGDHSVVVQTAPGVDGLQYTSTLSCMDGATEVATGGPASLIYGQNLVSSNVSVAPNQHIVCTFTHIHKGTIQLKNVVTPSDDSSWNLGIDASYTFWATWTQNGYDSGLIPVAAGHHTVVGQTAPGVNGLNYVSNMDCVDGNTHIASSTYGSLIYGQNLISSDFIVASNQNIICTFTSILHRAPNTPVLLSPANGSIKKAQGLVLDWSDVTATSSPVTYVYQSSLSPATTTGNAFASPIYNASLSVSQIDASGSGDNTYYWHVKACDAINSCSPWSDAWKITVDSTAPVTTFTSPNSDTEIVGGEIIISGITTDLHDVVSTTLAFAPFTGGVCGAFTPIITINSTTSTSSFGWTHTWIPADAGIFCLTAHGEDIAGNREASPVVSNITYKKKTTPVTPPAGGGGSTGGGGGGTNNTNGSTGGGNGGNGGGGNGPVVGSYGVGGDNSGGGNGNNTSPVYNSGTTFLSSNDNTGGGINTDSKKIATIYGSAGAGISAGNEPGTLTSTSSQADGSAVSGDNSNQTASVIAGASWLTWQNGLWILLILLLIAFIVWFVSRRKENQ